MRSLSDLSVGLWSSPRATAFPERTRKAVESPTFADWRKRFPSPSFQIETVVAVELGNERGEEERTVKTIKKEKEREGWRERGGTLRIRIPREPDQPRCKSYSKRTATRHERASFSSNASQISLERWFSRRSSNLSPRDHRKHKKGQG